MYCYTQYNKRYENGSSSLQISRETGKKLPSHILKSFLFWVQSVEEEGVDKIRKLKGYHDEPLRGKRKGQRSVRLNLAYRAIYTETRKGVIKLDVIEVNKHEY